MGILLLFAAAVLFGGFAFVQIRSLSRWRGGWRLAAALPLLGVVFVVARIVLDTRRDPTSHNLWPFEIVIGTVVALAALGLLHVGERASRLRKSA